MNQSLDKIGIITGASRGLGLATARALADRGWTVVVDARNADDLFAAKDLLGHGVIAIPGDVSDSEHRQRLFDTAIEAGGGLDLLINNASVLGASPQPILESFPLDILRHVLEVNYVAPLALIQAALPTLRHRHGIVVNITSDAAVEAYPGWGGYGSSKAALNQVTAILAAEEPDLAVYSFDPGDMNTEMHQEAFPGEDISDRPPPEQSVPPLLALLDGRPPSGLYRASDVVLTS
jgi:NAD(P)-dependent dehydrogenase (short-subunit alcohol dehydrogenase family)